MSTLLILGAALLLLILIIAAYNHLVTLRNAADAVFATIDAQLLQRCDLIPNLVGAVKAYMTHESETLTQLSALRSQALAARTPQEKVAANNRLGAALRGFMVNVEAYPALRASENMMHLQRSLNECEAQIAAARRAYNASVTDYNTAIQCFPMCLLAAPLGFRRRDLIEATEEQRRNPNVRELFGA